MARAVQLLLDQMTVFYQITLYTIQKLTLPEILKLDVNMMSMVALQEGADISVSAIGIAGNNQSMDAVLRLPKGALNAEIVPAAESLGEQFHKKQKE